MKAGFAGVAVAQTTNREMGVVDSTQGRDAVDLLSRCGARILPHHLRTIALPKQYDTREVRQALALLGYGDYTVAHLETQKYRGQAIAVVETALRAVGGLPC